MVSLAPESQLAELMQLGMAQPRRQLSPTPWAVWGEGWLPAAHGHCPEQPGMSGQPAGHGTGGSACSPLHLPPARQQLPGSGRCRPHLPWLPTCACWLMTGRNLSG